MATIPLQLAQRRLEAGNGVSYPEGSPAGRAMQDLGDELSAVAERYRQMKERQEAFDAELARRRFADRIAQAEDDVAANAPADGSGLHDAMYGEVDPRSGQVVKPGLFDRLFDEALPEIPESRRAAFARQKEPMRAAGSPRMAQRQQEQRDEYELAEWAKVDTMSTSSIAKGDPNDIGAFEAIRQNGSDLIAKIGNPVIRQAAEVAWRSNTAKALVQAMIAQDPKRAAEMLGGAPADSSSSDASDVSWIRLAGSSDTAAAKGNRVGKLAPDEIVAQAFGEDIPQDDRSALLQQAQAAHASQQVEMRTRIGLAEQNAPRAIRDTGSYSGPTFTPEQFVGLYGATEGFRRFQALHQALDVSRQFHGMRTMSNDAVQAMVKESAPKADSATPEEDRARYDAIAAAADLTFQARRGDPGGYVRKTFAALDAAWNNLSKPEDYQTAIVGSIAAQQQLGLNPVQPLPNSVAKGVVGKFKDEAHPPKSQQTELRNVLAALPNQEALEAVLGHLLQASASQADNDAANSSLRAAGVDPMGVLDLQNTVQSGWSVPTGYATNRYLTARERLGNLIAGDSEPGSLWRFAAQKLVGSEGLGNDGISVADFTPVVGASLALDEALNAALDGNYSDAVLDALGTFPGEKLVGEVFQGAKSIAKPWVESSSVFSKRSAELAKGGEILVRGVDAETLRSQQAIARSVSRQSRRRRTRSGEISESAFEAAMLASLLSRDASMIKYAGAKVGWTKSKNYRKTFFKANPALNEGDYVVHHSVEQNVLDRYPGLFASEEIHSLENLRGVRKEFDVNLHLKVIRAEWDEFYKTHITATRQQVLDYATELDKKYGHLFDPPIGE
ncbi:MULTISPECIES: hypothetical protein [unclassified Mesorhizobium]|uniref:hypothetical protein n=1 Tax=unclassified Mesorhizobium TaxID=325217 RepID=UPI0015E27CFC|nr:MULTISPECIES: hypothetical protein [unclassified Mesorhizobium]MCA0057910.1 hypothetical protein [Mesorhizobium sp. B261B1A]